MKTPDFSNFVFLLDSQTTTCHLLRATHMLWYECQLSNSKKNVLI
jgi:hypothetical protein